MAVDIKEYVGFTGITEGYASEILKDKDHAIWHLPSGAAKEEKREQLYNSIIESDIEQQNILVEEFLEKLSIDGDISLDTDLEFYETFANVTGKVNLDLNNHNIVFKTRLNNASETTSFGFVVNTGAELNITGNGNIICEESIHSNVVWAYGGNIIINDGYYENLSPCLDVIYASKTGELIINGGEFKGTFNDRTVPAAGNDYNVINKLDADRDKCSIKVRGGRFYGFDPANNLSEGPNTNFVDEGYESIKDGDWYIVRKK